MWNFLRALSPLHFYYMLIHCYGSEYINMPMMSKWSSPKTSRQLHIWQCHMNVTGISKLTSKAKWLIFTTLLQEICSTSSALHLFSCSHQKLENYPQHPILSITMLDSSQVQFYLQIHLKAVHFSLTWNTFGRALSLTGLPISTFVFLWSILHQQFNQIKCLI